MKRWIAFLTILMLIALPAAAERESRIFYLYVPACESCARAVKALEALPESVSVEQDGLSFDSPVRIEKIDASVDPERAMAMFDRWKVPEDERITPIVFFADKYLSGAEAIEKNLSDMVAQGAALADETASSESSDEEAGGEAQKGSALSLAGTLGAGLVAGLNTCALSMLLLFLSVVIESRRSAGMLSACFLGAKFVCYLLIGFVLVGVLQRFNPHWIQPLAKALLTCIGAILIGLNVWDAIQARRERFGRVKNQLPAGVRGWLHRWIRRLTKSRVLIPATILLGFVVAAGEFLCAGQIYLMRLLSAVQSGAGATAVQLVVYCAAFIAPSAVLCALVLKGKNQLRASEFLAEHMAEVKLLTAAAMLALILAAWIY